MLNVKKLLTKVLTKAVFLDLIWTNPSGNSQTSTMGAQSVTVTQPTTDFKGFLVEFRCFYNTGEKIYGLNFTGMSGMTAMISTPKKSGNPIYEYWRSWYPSAEYQISFSDCTRILSNSADVVGSDTGCLVPIRIWGIKK